LVPDQASVVSTGEGAMKRVSKSSSNNQ